MAADKINLLDLTLPELVQLVVEWGEPRFRATQIWRWLYSTLAGDPAEMLNLPKDLRQRLQEQTYVGYLKPITSTMDEDHLTEKVLFETIDGQYLETVLMRYTNRNTICVSSQVGCPIGCTICATGQRGFVRNLTTGEVAAQTLHFARKLRDENAHVTNVVFMGMGEPMLNFDAVWRSILNLNDREGLALGSRRFTMSTAGVVPGIERLARESLAVGLAISLHAPDNALRDQLVPINRCYPLEQVIPASKFHIERTGRRVTFEYALMDGVNDSDDHARRTAALLRGLLCHVNLIPMNPTPNVAYRPSPNERVLRFQEILVKERIQTTVRLRRGVDIQAGCGQLRGQYLDTSQ
jgi:23S rRNA (adenine2503-C2)-methyltransferase